MKKLSLLVSLVLAFALTVWAQTPSPNDTQSGSNSSATQGTQSGSTSTQSGSTSMGQQSTNSQTQGSMGQGNMNTAEQGKVGKEQKLKGCLESENGTYQLREKGGKEIALTGSADMSQYANHEVVIHGDWASGAASSASSTSDMSKGSEKQFTVSKIDSVSDTCKGAKNSKDKGTANNPSDKQ